MPAALAALLALLWLLFAPADAGPRRAGLPRRALRGARLHALQRAVVRRPPHARATASSSRRSPRCSARASSARSRRSSAPILFATLAHDHFGDRARPARCGSPPPPPTDLFIGRLTFALGVTFALATLLACAAAADEDSPPRSPSRRPPRARSPGSSSRWAASRTRSRGGSDRPRHRGRRVRSRALALALAFPEGGSQPFGFWAFVCVVVAAVLVHRSAARRRSGRCARRALLYARGHGGRVRDRDADGQQRDPARRDVRRAAARVRARRPREPARPGRRGAPAARLPVVGADPRDAARARRPEPRARLLQAAARFLEGRADAATRVEIPFTRMHWESVHVARRFPLARGWEAQLDRKYNALFRQGRTLTAERYRALAARERRRATSRCPTSRSTPPRGRRRG